MANHFEEEGVKKGAVSMVAWLIIGMIIGAVGLWSYNHYYGPKTATAPVDQISQADTKDLLAKIGKLIILPTGEDPIVAKINDAAALIKDQVFYKGAQNGDVVFVYQKAAKAVVYSPSRNIIVNVGPVFLNNQQATTPAATSTGTTKK